MSTRGPDARVQVMGLFSRRTRELQPPGPFAFVVEEVFTITAVGHVLTGRVTSGWITQGQQASLLLPDGRRTVTVRRIEAFRRNKQQASTGEQVGVVLDGLSPDDLPTRPGGDHRVLDSAALRGVQLVSA